MYVVVSPAGSVVFRLDYRLNGRRETLTIGKYGRDGISLADAREACVKARKTVKAGLSPAQEKQREKVRLKAAQTFGDFAERWFAESSMADSTRSMRRSIYARDLEGAWKKRLLSEISAHDLRASVTGLRNAVRRRPPSTCATSPSRYLDLQSCTARRSPIRPTKSGPPRSRPSRPRTAHWSANEVRLMLRLLEQVTTLPTIRLGLKLILLTMVRKSELQDAVWDEIDFENAVWSIPKERMKRRHPHNVYFSQQALDIFVALKTCAGNSNYVLPSRYDSDAPMSRATFNRVTSAIAELARKEDLPLAPFTVHDLRRTGSTQLNELGFNRDWIEKCLAHEDRTSSRGVYNRAEYEPQRRHMLQEWANIIDAWSRGERYAVTLAPPTPVIALQSDI